MSRDTKTVATRTGVFVHVPVVAPREPEHRPPPASRLPSWVIGTIESEQIGGSVSPTEPQHLSEWSDRFAGVPVQVLPEVSSDDRMHELTEECWCNPTVELIPARIRHNAEEAYD